MARAREMSSELWLFGLKKAKYKMKKKKKKKVYGATVYRGMRRVTVLK